MKQLKDKMECQTRSITLIENVNDFKKHKNIIKPKAIDCIPNHSNQIKKFVINNHDLNVIKF